MVAARFCAARESSTRLETTTAAALPNSAKSGVSTSTPKIQAASGSTLCPATASMPRQNRAAEIQVMASAGRSAARLLPRMMLAVLTGAASSGSSVLRSRSPPMDCEASMMGRKIGRTRNIGSQLRPTIAARPAAAGSEERRP